MVTHFFIEEKYFYRNVNTFYTSNLLYPPLVPAYYFPLAHTLLSFVYTFTHNSRHCLVLKDNNYLWKEKTCIIFERKINDIIARKIKYVLMARTSQVIH